MKKQTLEGTMLTPMQLQEKAVKIYTRLFGLGTLALVVRNFAQRLEANDTNKDDLARTYLSLLAHAQRIGVSADALQILASQRVRIDEMKLENEQ